MTRVDAHIRVRQARLGDEPLVRALRLEALSDAPGAFASTYERECSRTTEDWRRWLSPGATFILERDGNPGGLVACGGDQNDPDVVRLMAMWVRRELRGSGAADALIDSVVAWTTARRAREITLDVVKENVRACTCYERNGFRATGREFVRERDGVVEITMSRPI